MDDWEDFFDFMSFRNDETAGYSYAALTAWLFNEENFFNGLLKWIDWRKKLQNRTLENYEPSALRAVVTKT